MAELLEFFKLIEELVNKSECRKKEEFEEYVEKIFLKTEKIVYNYLAMFSSIRINIVSGKYTVNDVIFYMLEREYELKDLRVFVRSFLENKYYKTDDTLVKFVAAIYGILECYPVQNRVIVDKSRHTINSYIKFCKSLLLEDEETQRLKILSMTDCILKDITTSWKTVCDCYRILRNDEI